MATRKKTTKKTTAKKAAVKPSVKKEGKVEVRILKPVLGKYRIVAEVGHVKKLHPNQAKEVVDNGDAEYIN